MRHKAKKRAKAQTSIEYMILFTMVAVIGFVGFKTLLPKMSVTTNAYYNKVAPGIYGKEPTCLPKIAGVVTIDEDTCQWLGQEPENKAVSSQCPAARPFMVARYHWGDECGKTDYKCCATTMGHVIEECSWQGHVAENKHTWRVCPANKPFMSGRWHSGDENGPTDIFCCSMKSSDDAEILAISTDGDEYERRENVFNVGRCSEQRPFMRGRYHQGDETDWSKLKCGSAFAYLTDDGCPDEEPPPPQTVALTVEYYDNMFQGLIATYNTSALLNGPCSGDPDGATLACWIGYEGGAITTSCAIWQAKWPGLGCTSGIAPYGVHWSGAGRSGEFYLKAN